MSVGAGDIFGGQNLLSGITLSATFIKCADLFAAPLPANCDAGPGPAYAPEIILRLISPSGTEISLVEADRYFGKPDPGQVRGLEIRLRPPKEVRADYTARHRALMDALNGP